MSDPERVLYDAGSFTASWRYAGTDRDGVRSEIRYDYRADLAGNRSHVAYATSVDDEVTPGAWEAYSAGGRTYTRYDAGGEPFYQVAEGGADVVEDALPRSESWSLTGVTEDGQTVTGEWEYSITRVGATDFADPDWLADAEAAATPTSSLV